MLFLGIDAGGTKTAFVLSDEAGRIRARYQGGGASFFGSGVEGIERTVREGVDAVCRAAGIGRANITWIGAGFPGYSEMKGSENLISEACKRAAENPQVSCECDCHLGWAGSLGLRPGINVVAGTGSICYGLNAGGRSARSGGWGAYCDEGSCAWVGERLISAFTKQADGRSERTPLYAIFREGLHLDEDMEFIHIVNHEMAGKRDEVARLQLFAKQAALAGDPVALAIYEEAASELCAAIGSVARQLGLEPGFTASYSGGLFRSGDFILAPLAAKVAAIGGQLRAPLFPPEIGAVLMAMRAFDPEIALPESFREPS